MTLPVLRLRNRGTHVMHMQGALIRAAETDELDCLGQAFPRGKTLEADGDFGRITLQALTSFQTQKKRENAEFSVDGECGRQTWAALGFNSTIRSATNTGPAAPTPTEARQAGPQGRIPGRGRRAGQMTGQIAPPAGEEMPVWMNVAWSEYNLDISERIGGNSNNPRILEYIRQSPGIRANMMSDGGRNQTNILAQARRIDANDARLGRTARNMVASYDGKRMSDIDETPWCGCFIQWCMSQAGYPRRPGFAGARSWRPSAAETSLPRYGAICVVEHTDGGFHVGFFVRALTSGVKLLGGNQGNSVSVADFPNEANYWYHWPVLTPT